MIRRLCFKFHLTQSLMRSVGCFADGLCEQLRIHKVGTGAGHKKSVVFYQLHAPQIDFTIPFYRIFDGASGFGKCGRIQDYDIILLALFLQLGKQLKDICTGKFYAVGKSV